MGIKKIWMNEKTSDTILFNSMLILTNVKKIDIVAFFFFFLRQHILLFLYPHF